MLIRRGNGSVSVAEEKKKTHTHQLGGGVFPSLSPGNGH